MPSLYYWMVAFLAALMGVTFFTIRLYNARLTRENEQLKWRLQETEMNLSLLADWQEIGCLYQGQENAHKDAGDNRGESGETTEVSPRRESEKDFNATDPGRNRDSPMRKVRLRRVLGGNGNGKVKFPIEGLETVPPTVGEVYRLLTDNGGSVRTSPVVQLSQGYIRTRNSVYKIELFEEA